MIKRTPQEIADFFQLYVAMNENGAWYGFGVRPIMEESTWRVNNKGFTFIPEGMIDIPFTHDWKHIYEPRSLSEKADSYNYEGDLYKEIRDLIKFLKEIQDYKGKTEEDLLRYESITSGTSKPVDSPHIGEVYIHKNEYNVVCGYKGMAMDTFIKGVMAWVGGGWTPIGGISFDKDGHMYQAMVRGV